MRVFSGRALLGAFFVVSTSSSVSACLEPNPEHDGLAPATSSEASGDSSGADQGESADGSAEGMDASADGDGSSSSEAGTMSDTSTSSSGGDGDSGTTGGDGTESLWHYNDLANCNEPLWCFQSNQGTLYPAGGELWAFECFDTGLAAPVTVWKFAYEVVANSPQLEAFDLELRERTANGPGPVVESRSLDPAVDGTVGSHSLDVGWEIDASSFCIGIHAPAGGLGSAIGLPVDDTASVPEVSWFRVDDGSDNACGMNQMLDVIDDQPDPTGNWCFAVSVGNQGN